MEKNSIKLIIIFSLLPLSANAYIDPGSGILLWQGLIAALGAFIMIIRNPFDFFKSVAKRIKNYLTLIKNKK